MKDSLQRWKKISVNYKISVETFYFKHFREELKSGYYIKINKLNEMEIMSYKIAGIYLLHLLMINTVYANIMIIVKRRHLKNTENSNYFDEFNKVFNLIEYLEKISDLDENEKLFVHLCKIDYIISMDPHNLKNLKVT
ncbi:MAG: hypothetical protein R2942_10420 [Ignavibacteria bacterium]